MYYKTDFIIKYIVNFESLSAWHLHHVEFTKEQNPEKPGRTMVNNFERRKSIERLAEEHPDMFNDYIFDGGMLLCKNKIEGDVYNIIVIY